MGSLATNEQDPDVLARGARQKLVGMAQAEGLSETLVNEMASWKISARAGNHYVFHLPDGSQCHSKDAVLAYVRRNRRALESSIRSRDKKRKHIGRAEDHSHGDTDPDGDVSTGLHEPSTTRGAPRPGSDSGERGRHGVGDRDVRRSARSQNQPKPIYATTPTFGVGAPPGRKYLGLETPGGGGTVPRSPPGQLPLLLGVLDNDMRGQGPPAGNGGGHGGGTDAAAVLMQILGVVRELKESGFYRELGDPERLRVERYVSAVTTLATRREARSDQLSVMHSLAPAGSGDAAKYALLTFMSNTVDHLEMVAKARH